MRMSTGVNGSDAENRDNKQNHSDTVPTLFRSSKIRNMPVPEPQGDTNPNEIVELKEELAQLKELMLIHLDMIEEQAERIARSEQREDELSVRYDKMKQRLERMERRLALRKPARVEKKQPCSTDSLDGGRRRRTTEASSSPAHTARKSFSEGKRTRTELALTKRIKREPDENENEITEVKIECKFLTTKIAYFTCVGEDQYLIINQETIRPPKLRIKISGPIWRNRLYTSSYTMEGTENLSDDAFTRRHYKYMVDEKKRKRWDVQRIREQRHNEKLRAREAGNERNSEASRTLWPLPIEGANTRITVGGVIPISVFGITIPSTLCETYSCHWRQKGVKKSKR